MREESRKKRIIIIIVRNRVKTICSQTSFGEHKKVSYMYHENIHVKDQSSSTHCLKVVIKVKVQTDLQNKE